MKQLFTLLLSLLFSLQANSQVIDTILFENFQLDPFPAMGLVPLGDDTTWVNADEDGLDAVTQVDDDKRWTYAEFYFTETFWPDFREKEFLEAIEVYKNRHRRFGDIK